jgi:hypothetical protein
MAELWHLSRAIVKEAAEIAKKNGMGGIRDYGKSKTTGQYPLAFNIQSQDKSLTGIESLIKVN